MLLELAGRDQPAKVQQDSASRRCPGAAYRSRWVRSCECFLIEEIGTLGAHYIDYRVLATVIHRVNWHSKSPYQLLLTRFRLESYALEHLPSITRLPAAGPRSARGRRWAWDCFAQCGCAELAARGEVDQLL